jgi:hypothetical protein
MHLMQILTTLLLERHLSTRVEDSKRIIYTLLSRISADEGAQRFSSITRCIPAKTPNTR